MQPAGLNLQQAPPLSVPFRFFVTGPLFGVLAAMLMVWSGEDIFSSRWAPVTLGVVHLLTLGFMTMAMQGAMFQMLPVLAGAPVPHPRLMASIVHALMVLGTLFLATGFVFSYPMLTGAAVALLGLGVGLFVATTLLVLLLASNVTVTMFSIGLATLALGVTLGLGLTLGASRTWGMALPYIALRDLHPVWGLLGWTGLLVAGVAYQVVPMFQMTQNYPRWLSRWFAITVCVVLALMSATRANEGEWAVWMSLTLLLIVATAVLTFAAITLNLQRKRRRRLPDATLDFWRTGMICVAMASLLWVSQQFFILSFQQADVLIGVLAIFGGAMSLISGMLCKIVPFLAWFHLQGHLGVGVTLPNVKTLLPEKMQRLQLRTHLGALVLGVAAGLWPTLFGQIAGIGLGVASSVVLLNVTSVLRNYHKLTAPIKSI